MLACVLACGWQVLLLAVLGTAFTTTPKYMHILVHT